MCLGSGSSKPALAQRTLPAEGTRPADESAKKFNPAEPTAERLGQGISQRAKTKNWDDVDAASRTNTQDASQISDSGIQY